MKLLVYANSPERSRLLLPWAHELTRQFGAEITILATREPSIEETAALEILTAELPGPAGGETPTVRREGDRPERAIAEEATSHDYDLVLLAPAGRRGFVRLLYGSMVGKVLRQVTTSVLIARAGVVPPRRILACVSGSRHSLANVRAAARIAVATDATVTIMMVLSQLPVDLPRQPEPVRREDFLRSDHPLAVHLRTAEQLLLGLGAQGGVRVAEGLVVDEILNEVEAFDHDLLVLGTHRAEDYDPMYEDLTSELVRKSPRSTLVVGARADLL